MRETYKIYVLKLRFVFFKFNINRKYILYDTENIHIFVGLHSVLCAEVVYHVKCT